MRLLDGRAAGSDRRQERRTRKIELRREVRSGSRSRSRRRNRRRLSWTIGPQGGSDGIFFALDFGILRQRIICTSCTNFVYLVCLSCIRPVIGTKRFRITDHKLNSSKALFERLKQRSLWLSNGDPFAAEILAAND